MYIIINRNSHFRDSNVKLLIYVVFINNMDVINYLRSPCLVAKIQNYFGVKLNKKNVVNEDDNNKKIQQQYEVTNKFWYYLFLIGTGLGDELFYASFIPFWFWNVDGFVGRRFVLVWTIIMYMG